MKLNFTLIVSFHFLLKFHLKQQQKELIELAEEKKAKQEAWANRKLHVKIKDSITGKKLLTS